jgi:predicted dehydrogenase
VHKKLNLENRPIAFGLVGAGRIAQTYVEAFQTTSLAKLVAVTDNRPEAAAALAETCKVATVPSAEAMAEDVNIDAVVIATPPAFHCDLSLLFLERGISVLCEKPVSAKVSEAKAIRDAAREHGCLFTMASKFRYVDDVVRAKGIFTSGILGEIILFENSFAGRVDMSSRWNSDRALSGGGVLIDNGTHSVDIMRYFLGALNEVQVTEARRSQRLSVEETIQMNVRSRSGVLATCNLSWSLTNVSEHYIEIFGSQGTLRVGWKESFFQQEGNRNWVRFGGGYEKVKAFQQQLDNFSAALCGTDKLLITADDAIASVEAIEAGYLALRERRWWPIGPIATLAAVV